MEARVELYGDGPGPSPHPSRSSSASTKKSPAGRGRTGSLPCPRRRSEICGAPCSRLSMQSLWCLFSMILRRRWLNSCQTCSSSSMRSCLFPSRLSQCLRSCLRTSLCCARHAAGGTAGGSADDRILFSLQRTMEHTVDIPVPGRGGRISGLQGFLPRQSSTVLHGSLKRISERIVEQIVDFPAGGGLQDFLPGQSSSASSSSPAGVHMVLQIGLVKGFFALFTPKMRSWIRTRGRNCSRVEPIHLGSSCGHLGRWRRRLAPH